MASASDEAALAVYYQSHSIPQRYNAGIVIASVLVSILGSYTTLLLLGRRTSNKGLRNWSLLLLAASTMASVGIWSMHFVGMNVTLHPSRDIAWHVRFNPGWTAVSLFVPLLALVGVFTVIGSQAYFNYLRITIAGIFFGGTVALMHYSASFNASFAVAYNKATLATSIVIACSVSTLALVIFFRWRNMWQDNFVKRLLSSVLMAIGVSGMHYCASAGTTYRVRPDHSLAMFASHRINFVMIIAISIMCLVVCLASIALAYIDAKVANAASDPSRRVLVASVTFNREGHLLVRSDGTLPHQVINTDLPLKDVLLELDNRQPTFQWMYALSWDWSVLTPFIDRIAACANGLITRKENDTRRLSASVAANQIPYRITLRSSQVTALKTDFLEKSTLVSQELELPLAKLGILFDQTIQLGTRTAALKARQLDLEKGQRDDASSFDEYESFPKQEGAMLVLVRRLDPEAGETIEKYTDRGYRFTETKFVAGRLASHAGIDKEEMEDILDDLLVYARRGNRPVVQPGGVYACLFGVRPSISRLGGVDTLVYSFARHQVPAFRLPDVHGVTQQAQEWLASMMGANLDRVDRECRLALAESIGPPSYAPGDAIPEEPTGSEYDFREFQLSLHTALEALTEATEMFPGIRKQAHLSAEILEVPSSLDDSTLPAQMILFHTVLPIPSAATASGEIPTDYQVHRNGQNLASSLVFTPYSLFSKAQMALLRAKASKDWARDLRKELLHHYPLNMMSDSREDELLDRRPRSNSATSRIADMIAALGSPMIASAKTSPTLGNKTKDESDDDDGVSLPMAVLTKDFSSPRKASVLSSSPLDDTWITPPPAFSAHNGGMAILPTPKRQPTLATNAAAMAFQDAINKPPSVRAAAVKGNSIGFDFLASSKSKNQRPRTAGEILVATPRAGSVNGRPSTAGATIGTRDTLLPAAQVTVRPTAVASRIRADGWASRAMTDLGHGSSSAELLGVHWE